MNYFIKEVHICNEFTWILKKKLDKCVGQLFDQQSDPELVIEFIGNIGNEPMEIEIVWLDPQGKHFKQSVVNMKDIKENFLNSTLFERNETIFINKAGMWTVELRHLGEVMFLKKHFLVISSKPILANNYEWIRNFRSFFTFDTFCIKRIENKNSHKSYYLNEIGLKSCFYSAYWSTIYPDPKSETENLIGIDFINRN